MEWGDGKRGDARAGLDFPPLRASSVEVPNQRQIFAMSMERLSPRRQANTYSVAEGKDVSRGWRLTRTVGAALREERFMCRNIKVLANFEPPASGDEIRASALQFVRKLSGTSKPSKVNEAAFNLAVDEVTAAASRLISSLEIHAPPRDREEEMRKAKERSRKRFA